MYSGGNVMKPISIQFKDPVLTLIDQRKLPTEKVFVECKSSNDVEFAIREMVVRGAPAIGATAAFGVVIASHEAQEEDNYIQAMEKKMTFLNASRPTAVNLAWAIERMKKVMNSTYSLGIEACHNALLKEAIAIYDEDIQTNLTMAKHGFDLIKEGDTILTHCNTGSLATVDYGTALGVIRYAHENGKNISVYADETRPRLQGGRLTAWELKEAKIPFTLIPDSVAATLIRDGKIDAIFVGADRIAANGDSANKIGTFMLACVAKTYNVPFYIVAPTTTIDMNINHGNEIEIEERSSEEVTHIRGVQVAPSDINVYNPAFDVTPHAFITGIVTEKGVVGEPYTEGIKKIMEVSG